MKNTRKILRGLTLGALALVMGQTARAITSNELSQIQAPLNLVKNAGFESGLASWVASSPATVAITRAGSNLLEGSATATFTPTGAAQTLKSLATIIPNGLAGANCAVHLIWKGGDANTYMQVLDNTSAVLAASTFSTAATPTRLDSTFTCPASGGSVQLVIGSTGAGSLIAIDRTFLGAADLTSSSSSSAINYISNGSGAGGSVTGYTAYANTAQATPVTGAGGSPTHITIASSSVAPLRGTSSLVISNSGSTSAQGEGISYPFTINTADEAKVMNIQADYEVSSGTFVAGASVSSPSDLTVYIYDVTNAVVIQPATFYLTCSSTTLACHYQGNFQTASNSISYRLLFHVATTNTTAWALKLANVQLGPITYTSVTPVSDWQAYTPTFAGFGTTTGVSAFYRRVGDSIDMVVNFTAGTVSASTATVSLPSGMVIDTSKAGSGNREYGKFYRAIGTATTAKQGVIKAVGGNSVISFGYDDYTAATNPANDVTGSGGFSTSDPVSFFAYSIPITGFSSSVQSSDATDARVVAFVAQGQAATGTLSSSFNTAKLASVTKDTHSAYNSTTGIFTTPIQGYYMAAGTVDVSSNITAGQYIGCQVTDLTSGYTVLGYQRSPVTSTIDLNPICAGLIYANAGDQIALQSVAQGASLAYSTTTGGSSLSIQRVAGPNTISAVESVNARYENTAGTSIISSFATVPFATKIYDSHNAFNGSTGVFTAPVAGKYRITTNLFLAGVTNTTSQAFQGGFLVTSVPEGLAGTQQLIGQVNGNGVSNAQQLNFSKTYQLNSGDTLAVQAANSNTIGLNTPSGRNYVNIERVGN